VVAQGDFEFHFPDIGRDAFEVGLFAFAHDIEGVTDVNGDVFVLGGVVNAIFADEENAAFGVLLVDADIAGRNGDAQAGFFVIF